MKMKYIGLLIISLLILLYVVSPVGFKLQLNGYKKVDDYYSRSNSSIDYRVYIKDGKLDSITYEGLVDYKGEQIMVMYKSNMDQRLVSILELEYNGENITCMINIISTNNPDCELPSDLQKDLKNSAQAVDIIISRDFPFNKIPRFQTNY